MHGALYVDAVVLRASLGVTEDEGVLRLPEERKSSQDNTLEETTQEMLELVQTKMGSMLTLLNTGYKGKKEEYRKCTDTRADNE